MAKTYPWVIRGTLWALILSVPHLFSCTFTSRTSVRSEPTAAPGAETQQAGGAMVQTQAGSGATAQSKGGGGTTSPTQPAGKERVQTQPAIVPAASGQGSASATAQGSTTTLILVRHAERNQGLNQPLNEEGLKRAAALAEVVRESGLSVIYCPDLPRNRQTCDAVAKVTGAPVNLIPEDRLRDPAAVAKDVVEGIRREHTGKIVLFVGNAVPPWMPEQSGNLQEVYRLLGGTGDPPGRYQDLFIAIIPAEGPARFIKATYGGPSSLD